MMRGEFRGQESFDEATLQLLYRAFDAAWAELASQIPPRRHVDMRAIALTAIMNAAVAGERDPAALTSRAREEVAASLARTYS
jgi:hypothetical protein